MLSLLLVRITSYNVCYTKLLRVSAQSLEFQSVAQWQSSAQGLTPLESTMMVAIPELEGATGPMSYNFV